MTIDDRLTRAGAQFRDTHTEPADVHLDAPTAARRPVRPPRPRGRFVAIATAATAVVALTVGVLAWVASTGRPVDRIAAAPEAINGTWTLVAARDGSGDIPLPVASRDTPQLRVDLVAGRLTAGDGCNDHDTGVSGDATSLTFDSGSITAAGCPAEGTAFREAIGRLFLAGTASYQLEGHRLTITRDGTTLTYVDTVWELAGTEWRLRDVDSSTLPPSTRPTSPFTLSVSGTGPDQVLRLDDGCNVTNLPVDVGADRITITGQAMTTAVSCARRSDDPAVTAAVGVFGATTVSWSISGNVLSLAAAGTIVRFDAA